MRSGSLVALAALAAACGSNSRPSFQVTPGDNVLPVSVNGTQCGNLSTYVNEPCVSVKVCEPGTATCQTIDGVLLDTGSIGLRLFKQALTLSLPAAAAPAGGSLAECVRYADGTADWGPVETADIVLANEPAVTAPIQVIDSTYATVPSTCPSPETGPSSFNGILGLGVFVEDCGSPSCPADANVYFAWDGTTLTSIALDSGSQVQNPAGLLPVDNNGFIIALPGVPAGGTPSIEGAIVLGIGTRPNNHPVSASALALDGFGEFQTTLSGGSAITGSFVDTGSNGLFFSPPSAVPDCGGQAAGWFCPSPPNSTLSYDATNTASPGFPGNPLGASFQIENFNTLLPSNAVFADIGGGALPNTGFDWGLPFFLGRTIYLGINGTSSNFGPGPMLAY